MFIFQFIYLVHIFTLLMIYSLWYDLRQVTLCFSFLLLLLCLSVPITGFASDSLSMLVTGAAMKRTGGTIQRLRVKE